MHQYAHMVLLLESECRTEQAFPGRVDDGQIVTGASTDHEIKRPPLLNLQRNRERRHKCVEYKDSEVQRPKTRAHMLACDAPDVSHIDDLSQVSHYPHRDGVLTHFWRHVALHLNAQLLQHQQPWQQNTHRLNHTTTWVWAKGHFTKNKRNYVQYCSSKNCIYFGNTLL